MADTQGPSAGEPAPQTQLEQQPQQPSNSEPDAGNSREESSNTGNGRDNGRRGQKRSRGHDGKGRGSFRSGGRNSAARHPRDQPHRDFKRRRLSNEERPEPAADAPFTSEEIAAEGRRPKHKVAVMIGYSGTGYLGMQINPGERTIEGDLFNAFVAAGAISRANADNHRKSSLVRCARTDKGVHAAGNVISLKLIIEDGPDVVRDRINEALPPQIRVWGIQRTNGGFSCYQACDSRWYEYLMPSYCLLPPHPDSYMWKELVKAAQEKGVYDDLIGAMEDVKGFWEKVDTEEIKPILERLDPEVREQVLVHMHASEETFLNEANKEKEDEPTAPPVQAMDPEPAVSDEQSKEDADPMAEASLDPIAASTESTPEPTAEAAPAEPMSIDDSTDAAPAEAQLTPVELALRDIKAAYVAAKRRWRITPVRMERMQAMLAEFVGTRNFYNYTIQKAFRDPSAKRHIRSFELNTQPVIMGNTEWLSIKIHGQSFMMHQIRKMVGLASLMVRCATPIERIGQTFENRKIAIPKAPGLGLLLERPVFESYNLKAKTQLGRDPIDFDQYEQIAAFKDKHIYSRIFEVEEKEHTFHGFFTHVDNFRSPFFLWLTANGITDELVRPAKETAIKGIEEDEDEDAANGEG